MDRQSLVMLKGSLAQIEYKCTHDLSADSLLTKRLRPPAIQTTAKLVQLLRKPAFVVFTAGNCNAPYVYPEAGELVDGFVTLPCPVRIPDRAVYSHASEEGRTVMNMEPTARRPQPSGSSRRSR